MPQEFHVLRCFSCSTFQVQQRKKSNKWTCKVCGEKQSVRKVYGEGSGLDCRKHVQKLNMLRSTASELEQGSAEFTYTGPQHNDNFVDLSPEKRTRIVNSSTAETSRKWLKYQEDDDEKLSDHSDSDGNEESTVVLAYKENKPNRKRKTGSNNVFEFTKEHRVSNSFITGSGVLATCDNVRQPGSYIREKNSDFRRPTHTVLPNERSTKRVYGETYISSSLAISTEFDIESCQLQSNIAAKQSRKYNEASVRNEQDSNDYPHKSSSTFQTNGGSFNTDSSFVKSTVSSLSKASRTESKHERSSNEVQGTKKQPTSSKWSCYVDEGSEQLAGSSDEEIHPSLHTQDMGPLTIDSLGSTISNSEEYNMTSESEYISGIEGRLKSNGDSLLLNPQSGDGIKHQCTIAPKHDLNNQTFLGSSVSMIQKDGDKSCQTLHKAESQYASDQFPRKWSPDGSLSINDSAKATVSMDSAYTRTRIGVDNNKNSGYR